MSHSAPQPGEGMMRDFEQQLQSMTDDEELIYLTHEANVLTLNATPNPGNPAAAMADGGMPSAETEQGNDEDIKSDESVMLDEATLTGGLTNIGPVAQACGTAFLDCFLPGTNLGNIDIISKYVHLQKMDLSFNCITDGTPLSPLVYLIDLNLSNNRLTDISFCKTLIRLQKLDFSYNTIEQLPLMDSNRSLVSLMLNNNQLTALDQLAPCFRLRYLNLGFNSIKSVSGLDKLPLKVLILKNNCITKTDPLGALTTLQVVNLSGNKIHGFTGLYNQLYLESLDVEGNMISSLEEVQRLSRLNLLRYLNLLRNPIQQLELYRLTIVYAIPHLFELDMRKVEVEEKVKAVNMFNEPMEGIASKDHMMNTVYAFLQHKRVMNITLPTLEQDYPMLIVTGPSPTIRNKLVNFVAEEFAHYFGKCVPHSTSYLPHNEKNGTMYYHVNTAEFEDLLRKGQFMQTNVHKGHIYGLTYGMVEQVAGDGLATVVSLELEAVLSMRKGSRIKPKIVLVTQETPPQNEQSHNDLYVQYNTDHPGFFDKSIVAKEDLREAYDDLRNLILDYLGMKSEGRQPSSPLKSTATSPTKPALNGRATPVKGARGGSRASASYTPLKPLSEQPAAAKDFQSYQGVVLEESLNRRKLQAQDTVVGYQPALYEKIISKVPRTAPADIGKQLGLPDGYRPSSLPLQEDKNHLAFDDSDSNRSNTESNHSLNYSIGREAHSRLSWKSEATV